jgi:hypothetical protein
MRPKNPTVKAGLATLGLIWTSAHPAGAQEAAVSPLPASVPVQAPTNAPAFTVLLLSNGQVIQGNVSEDKAGQNYVLRQKGGEILFPKTRVEQRFGSMARLYEYKLARLPDRDPDERMKLARWCLENKMNLEAKGHLEALVELNPRDVQAKRMLESMVATAERAGDGRDTAVRTTGVEIVESTPREFNTTAIPRARGEMAKSVGRPVIFDLPAAIAFKRATEFTRYIHPVLQNACASCHNETHPGDFQLIPGRSRNDWSPDVVRANMDATLRYVNRDDPARSDILAYAANPHGSNARAVFSGPNDLRYRYLSTWLSSLKTNEPAAKSGTAPAPARSPSSPTEQFGAERFAPSPSQRATEPASTPGVPRQFTTVDVFESGLINGPGVPANAKFEVPSLPSTRPTARPTPPKPPTPPGDVAPMSGAPVPGASALPELPPGSPVPPPDDVIPPTNRPKKGSKLDPALLEKVMKARQGQP